MGGVARLRSKKKTRLRGGGGSFGHRFGRSEHLVTRGLNSGFCTGRSQSDTHRPIPIMLTKGPDLGFKKTPGLAPEIETNVLSGCDCCARLTHNAFSSTSGKG